MKSMKVIFVALAMLILPAPVMAQETDVLVAQAGDNLPTTLSDLHRTEARLDQKIERLDERVERLDQKIEDMRRDLGARMDALGARIDTLTTAVWAILGGIITALLGLVAMQIRREMRRETMHEHSAPPPRASVSASR